MTFRYEVSPFNRVLYPLAVAELPRGVQYPVCYAVSFDYTRGLFPRRYRMLTFSIGLYNLSVEQVAQIKELFCEYPVREYAVPSSFDPVSWFLSVRGLEEKKNWPDFLYLWCRFAYLDDAMAARLVGELKAILAHGDFLPLKGILAKDPVLVARQLLSVIESAYRQLPNPENYTNYSYDRGSSPFAVTAKLPKSLAKFVCN